MLVTHVTRYFIARLGLPSLLLPLLATLSGPARAQEPDGPKITPKTVVKVPAAQLRTPEQMAAAQAAALAAPAREPQVAPFMPTMDPAKYEAAKKAAEARQGRCAKAKKE